MKIVLLCVLIVLAALASVRFFSSERAKASSTRVGALTLDTKIGESSATSGAVTIPVENSRVPLKLPLVNPKIVIHKSARRLRLYAGGEVVRTYRVGLGLSPVEDKIREGDRRTPEGEFYVTVKNEKSAYYLSLGLSYPNEEDAARGLRDGLITKKQYQQIVTAIKNRAMPPQYTALGGLIYIHGNGSQSDWTWGCVALENEEMKELFDVVPKGTTVLIEH